MRNFACLLCCALATSLFGQSATTRRVDDRTIRGELDKALKKYDVPALGAAVVRSDGLLAVAVAGVRKRGSNIAVNVSDRFHLGSETKAMTATLIAIMVSKKLLSYDTTLQKAFPKLAARMSDDYRNVSLQQVLTHRGGLPANIRWENIPQKGSTREQRREALRRSLTREPVAKPGTTFRYSNLGYVVAAAMAERAADESWEVLMQKHLFGPLKMTTAGHGGMASVGKIDQPWSHEADGTPVEPGPEADNPPVMGPAGRVHCSLADWAKFVADQLRGANGKKALLPAEMYKKLLRPANKGEMYTPGGWIYDNGSNGPLLTHDGSNTINYATAILFPKEDVAVLVLCNQGGKTAEDACVMVRQALVRRMRKPSPVP